MPYRVAGQPLYEIKANLFKALAHPPRIRILEVLSVSTCPTPVSEIHEAFEIEPTLLSQHLRVLKQHRVVTSQRVGNAVFYEIAHPMVAELLVFARTFLSDTLDGQRAHLRAISALPPLTRPSLQREQIAASSERSHRPTHLKN